MAFGLKLRKVPKHEIQKKVKDAAHVLDLEELLERKPAALSGGQRQFSDEDDAFVKKANFCAKVDARTTARYGSKIVVAMDPEKIHVFDKETEEAVVH